jgi:hypothetical protein
VPSLEDFSRRITTLANNVVVNSDALVRKVALVADQAVVSSTPVDTGRARSNWIAQIGTAAETTIEPYAPGKAGSTGAANVEAARAQAEAVVATYEGGKGQEIHITNNLPYIDPLNKGHSAQAPAGYVEEAIQLAVDAVNNTRILDTPTGADK